MFVLPVYVLGLVLLAMAEGGGLFPRQSSSGFFDPSQIPTQCQTTCNTVVDNANTCTTFQCLCTPANDAAVLSCVNCVTSFNSSATTIVDGQDILNQFASQCNINNITVSSLSASGIATVTGVTTSDLSPPITSSAPPSSQSASATSPSVPTSSTSVAPSTTSNQASLVSLATLWPGCTALVVAALTLLV
ncbi:hypothetical protein MSAN_02113900 [Mycena sanguinolenta]|uniref:Extracellular membrane protein CFEM domain-containing protein n=1 Tax=Mycena sanguinolenta TaxID=230812 RepID=A0A8H6XHP4_9AGAR|nr:hypothetical protein MSAN_02113900 [Mycena sanguinolenta]